MNLPATNAILILILALGLSGGCASIGASGSAQGPVLQRVSLNDPVRPVAIEGPVALSAAKNEWVSFILQVEGLPPVDRKKPLALRLHPLQLQTARGTILPSQFHAYQVVPMPVQTNRAGYVRHTGLSASADPLPRALVPLPSADGVVNLAALRDPQRPNDSRSSIGAQPALIWIDLHVPSETATGPYAARVDLQQARGSRPLASLQVNLTVHDFLLPEERHLTIAGELDWHALVRHFPSHFEAVTPRLLGRNDPRYDGAVRTLDRLADLAQRHRVQIVVPRLQPTVKWGRSGEPPLVDWAEFDSLVTPWLRGDVFEDRIPLGFWPLPEPDYLDRYDRRSQLDYWSEAARHFDQRDWLNRAAMILPAAGPGRADIAQSLQISADAAELLQAHPRLRLMLPLEEDQLRFAGEGNPRLIPPAEISRILTTGKGLVFAPPLQAWPTGLERPPVWLRTDLPGLVPYVGAGGDERDVRLWAWLAFLRRAELILWKQALPADGVAQRADPNQTVWFYPGEWFGQDAPVPTVHLKWLRRAQQDYEYLHLARQRGEVSNALVMARLITKPVEIQPTQLPDPIYSLMSGTTDPAAWDQVLRLLAQTILLREAGQSSEPADRIALNTQTIQWVVPQEKPLLVGRSAQWLLEGLNDPDAVSLRLGVDVYNASDNTPDQNLLQFIEVPPGWEVHPQPVSVPALATYQVRQFHLDAQVRLSQVENRNPAPVEVQYTNGFTMRPYRLQLMLPVAHSDRRESSLTIDGSTEEWHTADAIVNGPMTRFIDRPTLQRQQVRPASVPAQVYTTWAGENFYLAFRLTGIENSPRRRSQNFVDYQFRRAWDEDLAEILIQPVYADNSLGPVLHVVCKPGGHWVERRLDPRLHADPWQPVEGAAIRYVGLVDGADWQGEVAIPWKIINDPAKGSPRLLRFNFVQHRNATGESASWAGPIDFGRDQSLTGLLHLRELDTPGLGAWAQ